MENLTPYFVAVATVPAGNRFRGYFERLDRSPSVLLAEPPSLREMGFDMRTLDTPSLSSSRDYWQVENGARKVLRLYQDGTLLFRGEISPDFLAWAQPDAWFEREPILNPVPLVEVITTFVRLYAALADFLLQPPPTVTFSFSVRNGVLPSGARVSVRQYFKHGIENVHNPRTWKIHASEAEASVSPPLADIVERPDHVAFGALRSFYALFDAQDDIIPFVDRDGAAPRVDVEQIRAL